MNPRILLIEDNQSDIELLRTAFEEAGMQPDLMVFRDGDEAISGIRRFAINGEILPQLVFLTSTFRAHQDMRYWPSFGSSRNLTSCQSWFYRPPITRSTARVA